MTYIIHKGQTVDKMFFYEFQGNHSSLHQTVHFLFVGVLIHDKINLITSSGIFTVKQEIMHVHVFATVEIFHNKLHKNNFFS